MSVRKLDPVLIDRIAAGEVVERPASAVKELVENSIDAKAKKILVEIKGGGFQLILVEDDGSGMSKEDMKLSLERLRILQAANKVGSVSALLDRHCFQSCQKPFAFLRISMDKSKLNWWRRSQSTNQNY